jgi:hypothetical protein
VVAAREKLSVVSCQLSVGSCQWAVMSDVWSLGRRCPCSLRVHPWRIRWRRSDARERSSACRYDSQRSASFLGQSRFKAGDLPSQLLPSNVQLPCSCPKMIRWSSPEPQQGTARSILDQGPSNVRLPRFWAMTVRLAASPGRRFRSANHRLRRAKRPHVPRRTSA